MKANDFITKLTKAFILLVLFSVNFSIAKAQVSQTNNVSTSLLEHPKTCEDWLTTLNFAGREWEKNKDSILIVIVRPGKKDSRRINLQRIKTLKEYLLNPTYKIKAVFAEGERVEKDFGNYGLVEFYVEGKLVVASQLEPKQDVPINLCE